MRALLLAAVASAVLTSTAAAGGVYATLPAADAAACARQCADDGLCIAWAYRGADACDLRAVAPASSPSEAIAFGFSSRAPAALRTTAAPPPISVSPPEGDEAEMSPEDAFSALLLGGLERGESDMRPRLGD
jgi:hypothetical protein